MEIKLVDSSTFKDYIEEFRRLYELCFNLQYSVAEIEWRYFQNPVCDLIACFALDKGRLVANYSVSPIILEKKGKDLPAVLSLNTMTHPDYIGKGLFVELASRVYNRAKEMGYSLVFGFPNKISNRTFVTKLDWFDIYEIPMMELDVKKASVNIEGIKEPVYDNLFQKKYNCLSTNCIRVKKDSRYLRWRYAENPSVIYRNIVDTDGSDEVISFLVYKEYKNRINIVDYSFASVESADILIKQLFVISQKMNKDYISTWSKLGTPYHILLEKYGFYNSVPITYFGANWFNNHSKDFEGYKYDNWEVFLSDDNSF